MNTTSRTRIKISGMDVYSVSTMTMGNELSRCEIESEGGRYLGTLVYMRRRHGDGGSTYGWRPEKFSSRSALTTKAEAVRDLLGES